MNGQRKQELMDELAKDMREYLMQVDLKQNFIDTTCRTREEVKFMEETVWFVGVEEGEEE